MRHLALAEVQIFLGGVHEPREDRRYGLGILSPPNLTPPRITDAHNSPPPQHIQHIHHQFVKIYKFIPIPICVLPSPRLPTYSSTDETFPLTDGFSSGKMTILSLTRDEGGVK